MSDNNISFNGEDVKSFFLHAAQHAATKEELQAVKSELKEDIKDVKEEIKAVKSELKEDIKEVKEELQAVKSDLKEDIKAVNLKLDRVYGIGVGLLISAIVGMGGIITTILLKL